ncbi:hypothetical protein DH2020_016762 [Rehmannia glutinosa]|uniref:DNA-3-methyladenine glycosylase II n=1 Tax=Rehmannia glutinosa TaxID=99300 RepID=A0ABR0WNW9_REHGL
MNKKRTQHPEKAIKIRNPTKTIKKSTTSTTIVVAPKRKSRAKPNSHFQENDGILPTTPISSNFLEKISILSPDFYQIDALDLAPRLLGKHLKKDDVILQITEVEAYRPNDSACHGRFGITARTAPVFGAGGMRTFIFVMVFIQCLMWWRTRKELVQLSSFVPVLLSVLQFCANAIFRTGNHSAAPGLKSEKPVLLTGPGKGKASFISAGSTESTIQAMLVGQALGISTEWSNHPLFTPGGLELLDGPQPEKILVGPRVGILYASPEDVNALWRFAIDGSPWISAPKNTLRPP